MVQGLQTDQSKISSEVNASNNMRILRSALQVDDLANPELLIPSILEKVDKFEVLRHYRIADFNDDVTKLLELVAIKKGILKDGQPAAIQQADASEQEKKGKKKKKQATEAAAVAAAKAQVPDLDQAARRVLRDFLNNRLSFCSTAPEE